MSNVALDPNNNEEVPDAVADEHALLSLYNMKLQNILKTLPQIAANQNIRLELVKLHEEVKGSLTRMKAEIIRKRTPDS